MSTKFAVGDRVEATGKAIWRKDTVGEQGTVIGQGKGSHTYVKMDGPNTDYRAGEKCEVFTNEHLKFVEEPLADWEKELLGMSEPRKLQVGDRVRVLSDRYPGGRFSKGTELVLSSIHHEDVYMCGPKGHDVTKLHSNAYGSLAFLANDLEYIPEVPKEETVQEQQVIEAGDIVKVIDEVGGHGLEVGTTHTVKAVEDPEDGKFAMVVLDVPSTRTASYAKRFELVSKGEAPTKDRFNIGDCVKVTKESLYNTDRYIGQIGEVTSKEDVEDVRVKMSDGTNYWYSVDSLEPVVEKPKPKVKSQEIEKHEIEKGDLIVAFWQVDGVELRRKGVAHENDDDDDWMTSDGGYLTYDDELDSASHIYLIERPEKPVEPEIADGTYYVTSTMEGVGPWQVTVVNGVADWEYGDKWQHQAFGSYESLVQAKKGLRSDMVFHTEDPTPAPKPVDGMYRINEKDSSGKFEAFWSVREGVAYEGHTREAARSQGHPVNEGWFKRMFAGDTVYFNIPVLEPKSIQEQLDELGVKAGDVYRWQDSRAFYLFDGAGKVKVLALPAFTREVHIAEVEAIVDGHLQKV